jgi:hypothetical protein
VNTKALDSAEASSLAKVLPLSGKGNVKTRPTKGVARPFLSPSSTNPFSSKQRPELGRKRLQPLQRARRRHRCRCHRLRRRRRTRVTATRTNARRRRRAAPTNHRTKARSPRESEGELRASFIARVVAVDCFVCMPDEKVTSNVKRYLSWYVSL